MADQRAALVQQITDQRDAFKQQLADQRDAFQRQLADQLAGDRLAIGEMREMLNERYATQTKALDAAFLAQQTAMKTAFDAADKAVAAALESAEKAVTKAEAAAEKRFESVNEFRQQLTDQAATFVSRTEYTVNHATLNDKFDAEAKRTTERISTIELRLTSRLDLNQGTTSGAAGAHTEQRLNINQVIAVLAIVASVAIGIHPGDMFEYAGFVFEIDCFGDALGQFYDVLVANAVSALKIFNGPL